MSCLFSLLQDIDECATGLHQCVPVDGKGRCINSDGSYTCMCQPGYLGNGIVAGQTIENGEELVTGDGCTGTVENFFQYRCSLFRPAPLSFSPSLVCSGL